MIRALAGFLCLCLMAPLVSLAQEVSVEEDAYRRGSPGVDPNAGEVAPEKALLVLQAPVSLKKLSVEAQSAQVYSTIRWRGHIPPYERVTHRSLPLIDRAYDGVVRIEVHDKLNDERLPERLSSYVCDLVLCALDVSPSVDNYDQLGRCPYICERPQTSDEDSGPSKSESIRPDEVAAFDARVSGSLQD